MDSKQLDNETIWREIDAFEAVIDQHGRHCLTQEGLDRYQALCQEVMSRGIER